MPDRYIINRADLVAVADAIRAKNETAEALIFPRDFVSAVQNMETGVDVEVVGGTTQPSNPKENTIWVNTSTAITGWVISGEEPTAPVDGMVWIVIGESGLSINILKDRRFSVNLVYATIYTNGAWADAGMHVYMNGEWRVSRAYIVKGGIQQKSLSVYGADYSSGTTEGTNTPVLTQYSGYLRFVGTEYGYGMAYAKDINLTGRKKLVLTVDTPLPQFENNKCFLGVWNNIGKYISSNVVAQTAYTEGSFFVTLDISGGFEGKYIVGVTSVSSFPVDIVDLYVE